MTLNEKLCVWEELVWTACRVCSFKKGWRCRGPSKHKTPSLERGRRSGERVERDGSSSLCCWTMKGLMRETIKRRKRGGKLQRGQCLSYPWYSSTVIVHLFLRGSRRTYSMYPSVTSTSCLLRLLIMKAIRLIGYRSQRAWCIASPWLKITGCARS